MSSGLGTRCKELLVGMREECEEGGLMQLMTKIPNRHRHSLDTRWRHNCKLRKFHRLESTCSKPLPDQRHTDVVGMVGLVVGLVPTAVQSSPAAL